MRLKLEDLIVLEILDHNAKVHELKDFKYDKFSLNLKNNTWTYDYWENVKIGTSRSKYGPYSQKMTNGIAGVYNRNHIDHINRMMSDAKEFTKENSFHSDY